MGYLRNNISRREFLQISSGSTAAMLLSQISLNAQEPPKADCPNILWISVEDISPDLGCYGDTYAVTTNIDRLAARGVRYTNAYAHAGVCAPVRSGIITGMYPTTIGASQMRCKAVPPAYVKCFTEYLRAAGYYCTNNAKTDYQFKSPLTAWDECSHRAHWRGRAENQPFFAVFNLTTSHESQIRNRSKEMLERLASLKTHEGHDPAKATLPPYYPDTPAIRRDWAQYYDIITLMDKQLGDILKQLENDGLTNNTIVWFWADHGRGLPRAKRWIYDSGIKVPLIISVPQNLRNCAMPDKPGAVRPGSVNDDLVALIDFAPTMLSLAGVNIPDYMQGRAFLGGQKAKPPRYIFAARDRMDEAYDIIRTVRDKRFKYIRNYMPQLSYAQDIEYMNQMPTMRELRRLNAEGKLIGPQKQYFRKTKPIEELYDTLSDPHEINNLADDQKNKNVLKRMRKTLREWMEKTGDVGLIPEPEFDAIKWPDGKQQQTAEPMFTVTGTKGKFITIVCATDGASIAYKVNSETKTGWKLYTKPVPLKPGQVIITRAFRIGFKDSDEVRFKLGDKTITAKQLPTVKKDLSHWRYKIDNTDILERLREIKDLDGSGGKAIPKYLKALNDKYGSVRYWAVVGLHNNCKTVEELKRAKSEIGKLLEDRSPIVRIAAARAMCDWASEKQALPVLFEALAHNSESVRLNAITALKDIGDKARPAMYSIKAALEDPSGYVQRVARCTLQRLESCQ